MLLEIMKNITHDYKDDKLTTFIQYLWFGNNKFKDVCNPRVEY